MAADSTISIEIELQKALRKLDELQKAFDKQNELINQASRAASRFERVIRTAMTSATKAVKGALNVFLNLRTAVVGIASAFAAREFVNFGANYERQISKLNALTRATETEQLRLRKAIREVGSTTAFTATQAAEAANVLAALGRTSTQISKELGVVVKVAGATGTAIETVSEAVAAQMNVFGESAEQVGNIFAAAYSTSAANVEKLQTALGQVGPVAKAAGLDLTQTAGAISFLVDRGFRAEAAGTALRGVLVRLIDPAKTVLTEFDKLGVSFEEIQQLSFQDQMQKIADQLGNVSSQAERNRILTTIFGVEALAAANNFINALSEGNRVIDTQAEKLKQATDAAGLYGQITSDLRGAIDNLIAAVEDKLLTAFQTLEPLIKNIVKDLTDSVNALTTEQIIQSVANIGRALLTIAEEFYNAVRLAINSLSQFINSAQFQEVIALAARALSSLGFTSVEEDLARQKLVFDQALAEYRAARYELEQAQAAMGAGPNQTDDQRRRMQLMLASQQLQVDALQEVMVEEHRRYLLMESQAAKAKELYDLIGDQSDFFAASNQKLDEGEQKLLAQVAAMRALKDAAEEVPTPPTPSAGTPAAPTTPIDQQLIQQQNAYAAAQVSMQVLLDLGEKEKVQKQEISDLLIGINKRGVERTKTEQIIAEYEAEIAAVMLNENYTLSDKNKIVNALTEAKERELAASKEKLTIEQAITDELVNQLGFNSQIAGTAVSGYFSAGPNAGRAAQIGTAYTTAGGGPMGFANAALAAVMSNEKVASAIEEQFTILFDVLDPIIDVLADLQSAINRLISALLEGAGNIIENFADVLELGPNGYFGSGEFTRQIESIFSSSSSSKPSASDRAIAQASANLFTVTEESSSASELQPKINQLLSQVEQTDLGAVLLEYSTLLQNSIDNIEASKADVVMNIRTGSGITMEMTYEEFQSYIQPIQNRDLIEETFQKEFNRIDGEIQKLEDKAATVIASVISAVVANSTSTLNEIQQSAEDELAAIEFQELSAREQIEFRHQETLATIEQQRVLANLIEDETQRNSLLTAANNAEAETIRLKVKQLEQLEREQILLQSQNAESTLQTILLNFESTMEGIGSLVESIFDQVTDLLMSEFNLAPAQEQLEVASKNYGDLLAAALDPDATEDNIKEFQQFVNEYLKAARDVYKSSSTFQAIFESVLNDLTALGVSSGFNLTTSAVTGATSEIQDFIDATEDLDEGLRNTLTSVISDLTNLGEIFQAQLLEFIYSPTGMGIPLVITDDDIKPVLSGTIEFQFTESDIDKNIKLVDENGNLLKLDFTEAASFTANISGFYSQDLDTYPNATQTEESNFEATVSGFYSQDPSNYPNATNIQSAHFVANTSGWRPYDGTATFTAYNGTSQGWKNYSGTAIFNSSFTGDWDSITNNSASAQINVGVDFDDSPIGEAFEFLTTSVNSVVNDFSDAIITTMTTSLDRIGDELMKFEMLGKYGFYFERTQDPIDVRGGTGTKVISTISDQFYQPVKNEAFSNDNTLVPAYTQQYGNIAGTNPFNVVYQIVSNGDIRSEYYSELEDAKAKAGNIIWHEFNSGFFKLFTYNFEMTQDDLSKYVSFATGGLVMDHRDTIPAMLSAGEYIMSPETVKRFGVHSMNRINSGDSAALAATSDPELKRLLAELIVAVRESETEVNVYTDMEGQAKAAISEFRSELKERTRRQGENYVPVKYI